jgi:hypothetical protein
MSGICYKLTDQKMQTYNGSQWKLGEWRTTSGEGELCGPGWLHGYSDPLVALLHNPMHAGISPARLFRAEWQGAMKDDHGRKLGVTQMRLVEELPVPTIPNRARRLYAIRCALEVTHLWRTRFPRRFKVWSAWAQAVVRGEPTTTTAAAAAAATTAAATTAAAAAAAAAAASAAASAAAYAANIAAYAANNANIAAYAANNANIAPYAANNAANANVAGAILDFPRFAHEAMTLAAWHERAQ